MDAEILAILRTTSKSRAVDTISEITAAIQTQMDGMVSPEARQAILDYSLLHKVHLQHSHIHDALLATLVPSHERFRLVIKRSLERREYRAAMGWWSRMQHLGFGLTAVVFTMLVQVLLGSGEVMEAWRMYERDKAMLKDLDSSSSKSVKTNQETQTQKRGLGESRTLPNRVVLRTFLDLFASLLDAGHVQEGSVVYSDLTAYLRHRFLPVSHLREFGESLLLTHIAMGNLVFAEWTLNVLESSRVAESIGTLEFLVRKIVEGDQKDLLKRLWVNLRVGDMSTEVQELAFSSRKSPVLKTTGTIPVCLPQKIHDQVESRKDIKLLSSRLMKTSTAPREVYRRLQESQITPDLQFFTIMITRGESIEFVMREMGRWGIEGDGAFWNAVVKSLSVLANDGLMSALNDVLSLMKNPVTWRILQGLLNDLLESKRFEEVLGLWEFAKDRGLCVDNMAAMNLLRLLPIDLSVRVYRDIIDNAFALDARTLCCFARVLGVHGRTEMLMEVLKGVEGMELDSIGYIMIVEGLVKVKAFGKAVDWFVAGDVKDSRSTVYLAEALLRHDEEVHLKRLLSKRRGLQSPAFSAAFIKHYTKTGDFERALSHYEKMVLSGTQPDTSVLNAVVNLHVCRGDFDEAKRVAGEEMKRFGVVGDKETVDYLTRGAAAVGDSEFVAGALRSSFADGTTLNMMLLSQKYGLEEAKRLVFYMEKEEGISLNSQSFGILMDLGAKEGCVEEVVKLWDECKKRNLPDSVVFWNALLEAHGRKRDVQGFVDTYGTFKQQSGLRPNGATLAICLDNAGWFGDVGMVWEVWADFKDWKLVPNHFLSLIEALVRCGQYLAVKDIVIPDMRSRGIKVDAKFATTWIKLLNHLKWAEQWICENASADVLRRIGGKCRVRI